MHKLLILFAAAGTVAQAHISLPFDYSIIHLPGLNTTNLPGSNQRRQTKVTFPS